MIDRDPLVIGSVLKERYRLQKELGEGTIWLTYLARDMEADENVVVKEYMPAGLAKRIKGGRVEPRVQALAGLFIAGSMGVLQEAVSVAEIKHASIASVKAAFKENGTVYVVREHVEGQSIVNWANSLARPASQRELDHLCGEVLDALEVAHSRGVWHLDLTPEHILMRSKTKSPVLIDFGAARATIACSTRAIHTFVRPGYSPPDQHVFDETAQGPWTDVYGFAAVIYRLVTGRGPLDVVARNHKDEMEKASAVSGGHYRLGFLRAIDKAMALDPSARQQTIAELKNEMLASDDAAEPVAKKRALRQSRSLAPILPAATPTDPVPKRAFLSQRPALIIALVVASGALGSLFASRSALKTASRQDPRAVEALDRKAISTSSDWQLLLQTAVRDPARRHAVEQRLGELGLVKIALAETTIWRKPGLGEPFHDCPTCPELVVIPSGTFQMGSPSSEEGRGDDEDDTAGAGGERVAVSLHHPFALGRFAVTRLEYTDFLRKSGYKMDLGCNARYGSWQLYPDLSWQHPGFEQGDRHPVVCVSWHDAQAYATWLSRKTGQNYRLPTEQEREFATRAVVGGAAQSRYFFGDDANDLCHYANVADLDAKSVNPEWSVVNCHDGFPYTAPVGSFAPNAFGLYDMTGNVWEWTADCFRPFLARSEDKSPACSQTDQRALRGGSWRDGAHMARSATRIASKPDIRDEIVGFRVVRELPP